LDLLASFKPDIILLDIMMQGMDGYETCRRIRSNPDLKFTKILIVSAKTMAGERLDGYNSGADDYITKPFNDDELLSKIKVYLNLRFSEEFQELKKNLLMLISRDVRSPLAGLIGLKEFEQIGKQANQLLEFCDESLLLCDLKDGRQLVLEEVPVDPFIREIITGLSNKKNLKNLRVFYKNSMEEPVRLDPVLMREAVTVILENAIRYSSQNAEISVSSWQENGDFFISIADHGQGIARRLFQELSTRDFNMYRAGGGISYATAVIVARLHQGDLIHKANSPTGVIFTFRLPKIKKTE